MPGARVRGARFLVEGSWDDGSWGYGPWAQGSWASLLGVLVARVLRRSLGLGFLGSLRPKTKGSGEWPAGSKDDEADGGGVPVTHSPSIEPFGPFGCLYVMPLFVYFVFAAYARLKRNRNTD